MIERLKTFWSNDTVRGSMLFFTANMISAFGGLLLTIIIARLMGTSEYGVFGTLIGLMYFLVIPVGALDLLITKTVSSFSKVKVFGQTKSFIGLLVKKTGMIFFGLFLLLLALTIPLKEYLHIESAFSLILLWIIVYVSIVGTVMASTLKGLLNFTPISINLIFSMVVRIVTTVLVTYFIFQSHFGGLWGLVIAGIFGLMLYGYQLSSVWRSPGEKLDRKSMGLKKLGIISLLVSGAFTAMYSLDMIFVRHYLSGFESGIYASLATAGKMIFFAISPIAVLVLPIVSRKADEPSTARKNLLILTVLSALIGIFGATAFFMFPKFIVNTIFSDKFGQASIFLPVFGLVMLAYSLSNVFGGFLIGLNKYKSVWIVISALILQIILLNIFHQNIFQIIISMGIVFWILAVILFSYCWYATRKTN
ncbi:MAG: hypothetical protein Q8L51_03515 [Candidatus Amesbacteria bacterium]|nr:hypothetical protein [Candidatus Amesbacteria bacterium]